MAQYNHVSHKHTLFSYENHPYDLLHKYQIYGIVIIILESVCI